MQTFALVIKHFSFYTLLINKDLQTGRSCVILAYPFRGRSGWSLVPVG